MSVFVYSRLAALLDSHRMTVAELERQLRDRYGLSVNVKTLYRLTQGVPIQRADLEIAGAVAAVLGVGLDDMFSVDAVKVDAADDMEAAVLGPVDGRRMATLIERQARRLLTEAEWGELEELISRYGQLLHEQRLHRRAQRHGVPVEVERRATDEALAGALADWQISGMVARQQELAEQGAKVPGR